MTRADIVTRHAELVSRTQALTEKAEMIQRERLIVDGARLECERILREWVDAVLPTEELG